MNSIQISDTNRFLKARNYISARVGIASLVVMFLVFALAQSRNLGSPSDSFDEGWRLMAAKLIALGYEPYAEVYDVDAPLYPLVTGFVTRVALFLDSDLAASPLPARIVSLVMAIVGAVALALIGRNLYGPIVGGVAAFVMLFTPLFFDLARRALPEVAAVAMGIMAIWLVITYRRHRKAVWLVLGGIAFGLSLLFKLIFPFLAVLLLALTVNDTKSSRWRSGLPTTLQVDVANLVWLGLGALLSIGLLILLLDTRALYEQAWAFHMVGRGIYEGDLEHNYNAILFRFVRKNTSLLLFGLYTVFLARDQKRWIPLMWLALALIMLALQVPVRYRYAVILLPPLALLTGLFIQVLIEKLTRPGGRGRYLAIILGFLVIAWYLAELPTIWQDNLETTETDREFIQTIDDLHLLLDRANLDSNFIVSDEPALVFYLNKLIPPSIAELSKKRVQAGFINIRDLAQIASSYDEAPVLTRSTTSHLQRIQGFEEWAKASYLSRVDMRSDSRDLTLYYVQSLDGDCLATPHPTTRVRDGATWMYRCLQNDVGNQLTLVSAYFTPRLIEPGDSVNMILNVNVMSGEFRAADVKAFVHLLDAQSHIVAQADHFLFERELEKIPANVLLADEHVLKTTGTLSPGKYRLVVGFYHPDTLERIPVKSGLTDDYGAIILGDVEVR